ncbi:hypothetical protein INT44_008420, partial [Umbelopsis vinacea]
RTLDCARRRAANLFIEQCQSNDGLWSCCGQTLQTKAEAFKHAHSDHGDELQQEASRVYRQYQDAEAIKIDNKTFRKRRSKKGSSDPISTECDCDISDYTVILFYLYQSIESPDQVAEQHYQLCSQFSITGKVRVAHEGVNVTLAGTNDAIGQYIKYIVDRLHLEDRDPYDFFKPSSGCVHVFEDLSVKVVEEICPLNADVALSTLLTASHKEGKLPPAKFHEMLQRQDVLILDTRNYYESRIGKFEGAITPATRKFARFPAWVERNKEALDGKVVLTYCTGGIRCEKASAYLRQTLSTDTQVWMLDGGIHNYLEWSKKAEIEPLWKGKNYVFDARQSTGNQGTISNCQVCQQPCARYVKCSRQCHLLIICCATCEAKHEQMVCCDSCDGRTGMCKCEKLRRQEEATPIKTSPMKSDQNIQTDAFFT